jgi:hypothetical protein
MGPRPRFRRAVLLCAVLLCARPALAQDADPPPGPAVAGDVCADGKPHTFRLNENRDRLFASLAAEKGLSPCALWAGLSQAERDIFEMTTAFMGSCDSRLKPPPSTSDETALDHAQALYSINAPGLQDGIPSPVPSLGGDCGGYDSNRIFVGFDAAAVADMRESHEKLGEPWGGPLNPKHVRGYNWWRATNDPGGPHLPFTERDMICWGGLLPCWIRFANSEGPTWHFFAADEDAAPALSTLRRRRGLCGVKDPARAARLAELTVAFNWDHESDPLCEKDWTKKFVERIGEANFRTFKPRDASGRSCDAPPINDSPGGGREHPHAGLGLDAIDRTCPAEPASAPATNAPKTDALLERAKGARLP